MGAFLSAASHAPVMAVIMLFEMTLSYDIILPLLLCSVVAYYTSKSLEGSSLYSEALKRKAEAAPDPRLGEARVADMMRTNPPVVAPTAHFEEIARMFLRLRVNNLYVVDGGAAQVNAARAVLDELGVTDVAVIGLAKRLEEIWVPAEPDPVILARNSEGLYLLQRVRDEAHRFAISYHRSKRSKRMTASALDSVRGLGDTRRKALVTHFGSVARLRQASVEEITAVPGIGAATAAAVLDALGAAAAVLDALGADADPAGSAASEGAVGNDAERASQ
jgi:CBS domain-containing protein